MKSRGLVPNPPASRPDRLYSSQPSVANFNMPGFQVPVQLPPQQMQPPPVSQYPPPASQYPPQTTSQYPFQTGSQYPFPQTASQYPMQYGVPPQQPQYPPQQTPMQYSVNAIGQGATLAFQPSAPP